MKFYLISETDFNTTFETLDSELATVKNANQSSEICQAETDTEAGTRADTGADTEDTRTKRSLGRYSRSRALERQIERVVQKYKKRSKL